MKAAGRVAVKHTIKSDTIILDSPFKENDPPLPISDGGGFKPNKLSPDEASIGCYDDLIGSLLIPLRTLNKIGVATRDRVTLSANPGALTVSKSNPEIKEPNSFVVARSTTSSFSGKVRFTTHSTKKQPYAWTKGLFPKKPFKAKRFPLITEDGKIIIEAPFLKEN